MRITAQEYRMIDLLRRIAEEMHPLSVPEITRILDTASYRKKGLYLALLSSGMRIGEAVQVRRRDVRIAERVTIRIPAENTKTKSGRTVYISSEAAGFLRGRLKNLADGDLVWGTNPRRHLAVAVETARLAISLRSIAVSVSGNVYVRLRQYIDRLVIKSCPCAQPNRLRTAVCQCEVTSPQQ